MFIVIKQKADLALVGAAAKLPSMGLFVGQDVNQFFTDLQKAQDNALYLARANPGSVYEVYELVLTGSAATPAAVWTTAPTPQGA
jgi:hypothetical protein